MPFATAEPHDLASELGPKRMYAENEIGTAREALENLAYDARDRWRATKSAPSTTTV